MTSRDIGQDDFENTVTIPSPMIRSRHVETETGDDHPREAQGLADELGCPTCGQRFPGVATHCPDDGSELVSGASSGSPEVSGGSSP